MNTQWIKQDNLLLNFIFIYGFYRRCYYVVCTKPNNGPPNICTSNPRYAWMLFHIVKGHCRCNQGKDLKMKIILDYLGGPNATTMVLLRGTQKWESEKVTWWQKQRLGWHTSDKENTDSQQKLENTRECFPSWSWSRGNQPCWSLDLNPVKFLGCWPPEGHLCCLKPLN